MDASITPDPTNFIKAKLRTLGGWCVRAEKTYIAWVLKDHNLEPLLEKREMTELLCIKIGGGETGKALPVHHRFHCRHTHDSFLQSYNPPALESVAEPLSLASA